MYPYNIYLVLRQLITFVGTINENAYNLLIIN